MLLSYARFYAKRVNTSRPLDKTTFRSSGLHKFASRDQQFSTARTLSVTGHAGVPRTGIEAASAACTKRVTIIGDRRLAGEIAQGRVSPGHLPRRCVRSVRGGDGATLPWRAAATGSPYKPGCTLRNSSQIVSRDLRQAPIVVELTRSGSDSHATLVA